MILHGPHHSAQKSTSTGLPASRTSAEKLASVVALVAMIKLLIRCRPLIYDRSPQGQARKPKLCSISVKPGLCAESKSAGKAWSTGPAA